MSSDEKALKIEKVYSQYGFGPDASNILNTEKTLDIIIEAVNELLDTHTVKEGCIHGKDEECDKSCNKEEVKEECCSYCAGKDCTKSWTSTDKMVPSVWYCPCHQKEEKECECCCPESHHKGCPAFIGPVEEDKPENYRSEIESDGEEHVEVEVVLDEPLTIRISRDALCRAAYGYVPKKQEPRRTFVKTPEELREALSEKDTVFVSEPTTPEKKCWN